MKNKFNIPVTIKSDPYVENCIDLYTKNNYKHVSRYIDISNFGICITVKYKPK
jgi:hypothetical protein